jgi:hypothetical protein
MTSVREASTGTWKNKIKNKKNALLAGQKNLPTDLKSQGQKIK